MSPNPGMPLQPSNSRRNRGAKWIRWSTLVALAVCLGSGIGALVVRRIAALSVIAAPTINEDEYAARELAYKSYVYSRDATRGADTVAAALRAFDRYPELLSRPEFTATGIAAAIGSSSADATARVWSPSQARFAGYLMGHAGSVLDVAFSPDSTRVLSASEDRTARIWETISGMQLATCEHPMPVTRAVFSPDGTRVYTRAGDGIARAFNVVSCVVEVAVPIRFGCGNDTPDCLRAQVLISDLLPAELQRNGSTRLKVALSPDDSLAAIATDNMVEVRSMPSWSIVSRFGSEGSAVTDVQFAPDGRQFVTSHRDGSAEVRDVSSGKLALTVLDLSKHPYATFSDCIRLSSVGPASPQIIRPTDESMHAYFVPNAPRLVTYWEDQSPAQLWDVTTGKVLSRLNARTRDCDGVSSRYFSRPSFAADGSRALATWGPSTNLWLTESGKRIANLPSITTAALSPDGLHIVTTGLSLAPRLLPATALGGAHAACAYVKAAHWSLPEQYRDLPGICDRLPKQ